eukprot:7366670-Prymnesium_polylepis.1
MSPSSACCAMQQMILSAHASISGVGKVRHRAQMPMEYAHSNRAAKINGTHLRRVVGGEGSRRGVLTLESHL